MAAVILLQAAGDPLELAEEVQPGRLAGVPPLGVEQALGEAEEDRGLARVLEVLQAEIDGLADQAGVAGDRRPHEVGRR